MRTWAFVAFGRTIGVIVTRESTDSGETATAREIVRRCAGVGRTRSEPNRTVTEREPDGWADTDGMSPVRWLTLVAESEVADVASAPEGRPTRAAAMKVRPATQVRHATVIIGTLFAVRDFESTTGSTLT